MLFKRMSLGFVLPYLTLISFLKGIINFEREVLPILQERCVECHKATHEQNGRLKQPKAGLRLDGAAYIMHGSDGGPVVVVDHPSRSLLYTRTTLNLDDPELMPPKGDPLTNEQKEIIRQWIAQGLDFGLWKGATDGIENLQAIGMQAQEYVPKHLQFYQTLSKDLKLISSKTLDSLSEKTGLLIRPIGIGSKLVEARKVTNSTTVGRKELEALNPLYDHLVKLDLTGSGLTDEDCSSLVRFRKLTHLNLRGTAVGDEGLKELKSIVCLQYLNLCETEITDNGIRSLLAFENLKNLHLWKSQVSEKKRNFLRNRLTNVQITP